MSNGNLTHFDKHGRANMVDTTHKKSTERIAIACATIKLQPTTVQLIREGQLSKGDVLAVAQVAGIMAAKKTAEIIPMCHNINLTGVSIDFEIDEVESSIKIKATAKSTGITGVEMEALHAVSVTALTIYDMCKAVDTTMEINDIYLKEKIGGKSGHFRSHRKNIINASVVEINISKTKGVKKITVPEATLTADHGLEGDAHAGNWHRQVSLLAIESIEKMKNMGLEKLIPGDFAENITTRGITLNTLPVGTILKIGNTIHKVTQIGKECHQKCAIYHKVGNCIMPSEGIFTCVISGGKIKKDDKIEIIAYPNVEVEEKKDV